MMATILLSAAGAALGSGVGGSVLGLSGAVAGRALGATIGRSIDQKIFGSGSDAAEVGKIDKFYIGGVGYGGPVKQVWGRMRVAGEVIWATRFKESRRTTTGGKGSSSPATVSFSYTVSIALALCEGVVLRVGRIWADGVEISPNSLNLRFYPGSDDQLPDPRIEAVEGIGFAPSYRGICYVVIEDLAISRFGNRVPQFSFEVIRRAQPKNGKEHLDLPGTITAVSMIPGSGEYALATSPVHFDFGLGRKRSANVHTIHGGTDFVASLEQLTEELPLCQSVSLVISWFGSDLRCSTCLVQPKVEQKNNDGVEMPWSVSGVNRQAAEIVPYVDDRPVYGGTPADASVIEAITAIRDSGKEVMFYPFILMDQIAGNGLPDPWSMSPNQPTLPWRGRITLNQAPGRSGSTDQTVEAEMEIEAFLGGAGPEHFSHAAGSISYTGPQEWGYRRFILHYAHLCALAGGVDAFIIGSELRGLTQVRAAGMKFPMVDALRELAANVKTILGQGTRVSYAADWSEYYGYHVNGNILFHLDELWSDSNVDFIGIDNYMPISDWRDGPENSDENWGSIYNLDYLESNIAGGEGLAWYYDSPEGEASQRRVPIDNQGGGDAWIFRYKDLKSWWSNQHYNVIDGMKALQPTDWIPGMKPIIFTEYGCAAIDKATNQPNRFLDTKSSESSLPRGSSGKRDDFIQMQYFAAMFKFWSKEFNNPKAKLYDGTMLDFARSHAWAWDARPFPDFPGAISVWSDGLNYDKGHWLNGRSSSQPIASVVEEVCRIGTMSDDVETLGLNGSVRGFAVDAPQSPRSKLQSLMLAFGFSSREVEGQIDFLTQSKRPITSLDIGKLALLDGTETTPNFSRASGAESVEGVRLTYVEAEDNFRVRTAEAAFVGSSLIASHVELQIQFTESEANDATERWLAEGNFLREELRFSLPNSFFDLAPCDTLKLNDRFYRIERIEGSSALVIDAVGVSPRKVESGSDRGARPVRVPFVPSVPASVTFLHLPLLLGHEVPHAPHVAVSTSPWQGHAAVWSSSSDSGFTLNRIIERPSIIGMTHSILHAAPSGVWDRGSRLIVEVGSGELYSASSLDVLNGVNMAAIGDGTPENWEVLQFSNVNSVADRTYEISGFLRGLGGTDALAPSVWPIGSFIVILDGSVQQIDFASSMRGLTRNYRVGALELGVLGSGIVSVSRSFNGVGLRPYSVSHLTASGALGDDIVLNWIRRTRVDGDNWQSVEVPLGEESERYVVVVSSGAIELRRLETIVSSWMYTAAMQLVDGVSGSLVISVAQQSTVFGVGPFISINLSL